MTKVVMKLIPALALLMGTAHCYAQTAVTTAGGEAGTMSYSVGQPFVGVAESNAGSLTAGVQQAYAITVVDGIENTKISLSAEVFPNPVADRLNLRVDNLDSATLRYTLTDNNGRTIATDIIVDALTAIEMDNLVQGIYFVYVTDGETLLKTFKIVKK
jgi:hypothetical protein